MNNDIGTENKSVKKLPKKPEAEILLDRQLEMKDKSKAANILTIILFCLFVLFFGVMFIILPDNEYSQTEKRVLASAPDMSWYRISTGLQRDLKMMTMTEDEKAAYKDKANWSNIQKELYEKIDKMNASDEKKAELRSKVTYEKYFKVFSDDVSDYYSDQFPFRDQLRVIKAATEIAMLKQENNDVLFAGGYLIKKNTLADGKTVDDALETIDSNLKFIGGMQKFLPENVKCLTAVAGRTVDIAVSKIPAIFPYSSTGAELYWQTYNEKAKEYGINTVELKDVLKAKFDEGEYVYYKTDHHWTSLGAYYAYCEIEKALGNTPLALDKFERETFSRDFIGTTYAKAGAALGGADTIEFFRYEGDTGYVTEIKDDGTKLTAFYNYDYRDDNDKYSAFLGSNNKSNGGNNAVTLVTKQTDEPRKKMIVLKDSFGHSLVPFLATDYDLIVLDMRYYNGDMSEFLSDPDLSAILVIYNMETFSNNDGPQKAGGSVIGYYNK